MPEEATIGKRRKIYHRKKSSNGGRMKVCSRCNIVWRAFFRPTVFLPVYTLLYALYVYEGNRILSFINSSVFLIPVFIGPYKSGDVMYMKSQVQNW